MVFVLAISMVYLKDFEMGQSLGEEWTLIMGYLKVSSMAYWEAYMTVEG